MSIHDKIAQALKSVSVEVRLETLDDVVQIRKIRMAELEKVQADNTSNISMSAVWIALTVFDDQGKPLFADGDQVKQLEKAVFDELAVAVAKVNGFGVEDDEPKN